jgi:hypothetical protein
MFDAREEAVVANFNIALGGLKHSYTIVNITYKISSYKYDDGLILCGYIR